MAIEAVLAKAVLAEAAVTIRATSSSRISASTAITITVTVHCAGRAPTENELVNVAVIHTYFVNHV